VDLEAHDLRSDASAGLNESAKKGAEWLMDGAPIY
jgi:hypothetical protein